MAHAARTLGRPVIWESTRSEAFQTDDHAREMTAEVDIGFDDDHRIVGMRVRADYQIGAYLSPKSGGLMNNMGGFAGPTTFLPSTGKLTPSSAIRTSWPPTGAPAGPRRRSSSNARWMLPRMNLGSRLSSCVVGT